MSFRIILSDDAHIHARNFPSLFSALSSIPSSRVIPLSAGRNLWNRYGDYSGIPEIEERAVALNGLTENQLKALSGKALGAPINAFKIARAELLSYALATCENWYSQPISNDDDFILGKLYSENNLLLRLNLAATLTWCDIYTRTAKDLRNAKAAVVFSGSQIYQRILLEICKTMRARAFVIESFQTGTEFYFEENYLPVTAGSDIRFDTVEKAIALPAEFSLYQNELNKAHNKLIFSKNKNVTQPDADPLELPAFANTNPTVLIAAQVQNDFSIIESRLRQLNPIVNYIDLIDGFLKHSDFNIAIKTHPWERRKVHLGTAFTYENLFKYIEGLSVEARRRVRLYEDVNIHSLLKTCDLFVTQTSQSSFEACFSGLKPYVLGRPFYGDKGFTNDFDAVDELISTAIEAGDHSMSLEEYNRFNLFVTRLLQFHLASEDASGIDKIKDRLFERHFVEVGVAPKPQTFASTGRGRCSGAAPTPSPDHASVNMSSSETPTSNSDHAAVRDLAIEAYQNSKYAEAEEGFLKAFEMVGRPSLLRAAAEAADLQGSSKRGVDHLHKAAAVAKNTKGILARMREMKRNRLLRKLYGEKRYSVDNMEKM